MFDFIEALEDIQSNITTEIINDIVTHNIDIRPIFYGKYKLLLDIKPVKNTGFYKINNITKNKCYSSEKYIIPIDCFDNVIDNMECPHSYIRIMGPKIDNISYIRLINENTYISLNIYNDDIFEIAYLDEHVQKSNSNEISIFIKLRDNVKKEDIYKYYNTKFYNILKNITDNNIFDYKNYFITFVNNKITIRDFHPLFFEILNYGYIKFYKDINKPNKIFILFNYRKLYQYIIKRSLILDKFINYILMFNNNIPNITDFLNLQRNKGEEKIIFNNIEITLTNNIRYIPDYVLNLICLGDTYTNNIGMYEITVIN